MMARMRLLTAFGGAVLLLAGASLAADGLPFDHKFEVYREASGEVIVFRLQLEQPFLAEEFEKSNYLRLHATDDQAYLIYPKETKFHQKHAEFFGRLRGEGKVKLRLTYETVSENLDGSRRVQTKSGDLEVEIPPKPQEKAVGPESIYKEWARQQNEHFAQLLRYYPEETFYQYALLQSKARYGVDPPKIPKTQTSRQDLETDLYQVFTGSLAIQESLQREALTTNGRMGDLTRHISSLSPPDVRSLPFEELLEEQIEAGREPQVHEIARLVPADQYFLHVNSLQTLGQLLELSERWGGSLLQLFQVQAQDNRVEAKLENQLCLRREGLTELFADEVIGEIALTGGDPFVLEGADVSVILRIEKPQVFRAAATVWLEEVKQQHPDVQHREFNYRGHKVVANYTEDRIVSSFVVEHADYVIYSNSHRGIRRVIDTVTDAAESLHEAVDYRYVTTIMPPSEAASAGFLFVSEAAIKRLIGPDSKISQKRRLQCFNNLVMLNNASLFFRLEFGRSPSSLSELIERRFVDPQKVVCPHGGAYTWDHDHDTCNCSLHNRIRYLTPNLELDVLKVSQAEAQEYERYKQRYLAFWGEVFDPLAIRITVGPRVKLETCVLPFANSGHYAAIRSQLAQHPRPIDTAQIAPSAVASMVAVPQHEKLAGALQAIPGVRQVLEADPTLTDLEWLGDRFSLHLCDGETVLEIDPTQLRPLQVPLVGNASVSQQAAVATAVMAMKMPVYMTIDVDNPEKATRLLEQLSSRIFLKRSELTQGVETRLDAYRLPDYKQHKMYVFSFRVYAVKLRLHVSLVNDQLVAATKPEVLKQVIDASVNEPAADPPVAHMLLRLNSRGLNRLYDDFELYWAEKARRACHRNIISIYNLHRLYDAPLEDISKLSESKYGVRYYCPEHGEYRYDPQTNQVLCSVHGNREHSRQHLHPTKKSSFHEFIQEIDEVLAYLRFEERALIATVEIARSEDD